MDTVARLNFLIFDGTDDNWWSMLPHGHLSEVEFYEIRRLFMMIDDRRALIDIVARSNVLYFDSTDDDGNRFPLMVLVVKLNFLSLND